MAFQPVPNTAQVNLQGHTNTGRVVECVFHAVLTGTLNQSVANGYLNLLAGHAQEFEPYMNSDAGYDQGIVTDLRTEGAPQFVCTGTGTNLPFVGTGSSQPLPYQTSSLINWTTGFRGKSGRGRSFFGLFNEDVSNGNTLDAALVEALTDFADDIVNDAIWGVVSRVHDKEPRPTGVFNLITGYKVDPTWRTQKRRRKPA